MAPIDINSYKTSPVSDMPLLPASTTPPDDRFLREMMMQEVELERFMADNAEETSATPDDYQIFGFQGRMRRAISRSKWKKKSIVV